MSELKAGLKGTREVVVTPELATRHLAVGENVLATPMMIWLMEETCHFMVAPFLKEGQQTVGTIVCVKHLAATPVGMKVRAEVELVELDRRRLKFQVSVYDEREKVGEGDHERFIVDIERFREGLKKKLSPA